MTQAYAYAYRSRAGQAGRSSVLSKSLRMNDNDGVLLAYLTNSQLRPIFLFSLWQKQSPHPRGFTLVARLARQLFGSAVCVHSTALRHGAPPPPSSAEVHDKAKIRPRDTFGECRFERCHDIWHLIRSSGSIGVVCVLPASHRRITVHRVASDFLRLLGRPSLAGVGV